VRQAACLGVAAALAALVPAASAAGAHASSFEPEATLRRADRVAVLSLARAGNRLVAAGERGRILLSDDQGGSWKVAATPTYHTLTSVFFADAKTGFATGHQGVLLRTEDAGLTWKQAQIELGERPALFAVRVTGEHGIAVGAYGTYLETSDGGHRWTARRIGPPDFDRHLTGIASYAPGKMIIAGEAGTLLATNDAGATWQLLKSPYEGSFFGAIGISGGSVIAFGMRGNAWRTHDAGKSWQRVDLGDYKGALQGAMEMPDGSVVLSGADGMVAVSRDAGATFTTKPLTSRITVAALMRTMIGWVVASPAGLRVVP
jgi:photosystem II stability/assembly factor-like uncharacterized protein